MSVLDELAPNPWTKQVRLRDNTTAVIRPMHADDVVAWRSFYSRLSDRTVYRRFFVHPSPEEDDVAEFVNVDQADRMAFVTERNGAILGVGRYDRIGTLGAEVAIAVADEDQGNGIATLLLSSLIDHATARGIHQFLAATLNDSGTTRAIFSRAGFTADSASTHGTSRVFFNLPHDESG